MSDGQPLESTVSPEVHTREALRHFSLLIQEMGNLSKGKGKEVTTGLIETAAFINPAALKKITTCDFKFRHVGRYEEAKYATGKDPGLWLKIETADGKELHINIKDGLRRISEGDSKQTVNKHAKNQSSASFSAEYLSEPTEININYLLQGMPGHFISLRLTPGASPDSVKHIFLADFDKMRKFGHDQFPEIKLFQMNRPNPIVDNTRRLAENLLLLRK